MQCVVQTHTHAHTSVFYVQLHILFDNCYTFLSHSLSREFNGFNRSARTLIHLLTSASLSLSRTPSAGSFSLEKLSRIRMTKTGGKPKKELQWHFVCECECSTCIKMYMTNNNLCYNSFPFFFGE